MRTSLVINAEADAAVVTALRVVILLASLEGVVVIVVMGWW
jgi:hypothetical protein